MNQVQEYHGYAEIDEELPKWSMRQKFGDVRVDEIEIFGVEPVAAPKYRRVDEQIGGGHVEVKDAHRYDGEKELDQNEHGADDVEVESEKNAHRFARIVDSLAVGLVHRVHRVVKLVAE